MGHAKNLGRQIGLDTDKIIKEMQDGDYDNLVNVFDRYFGSVVELTNRP